MRCPLSGNSGTVIDIRAAFMPQPKSPPTAARMIAGLIEITKTAVPHVQQR